MKPANCNRRYPLLALSTSAILIATLAACGPPPAVAPGDGERDTTFAIEALADYGSLEDIIEISSTGVLIGSTMNGRGLTAVDTADRGRTEAWPAEEARAELDARRFPECPSALAPGGLSPHGLFYKEEKGTATIWAVNHGAREAIEAFSVSPDDPTALTWVGCVPLPEGVSANGIAVTDRGELYVTNFFDPADVEAGFAAMLAGANSGDVRRWSIDSGWELVEESALSGPNGVTIDPMDGSLWVSAWGARKLVRFDLDRGERSEIEVPFMPDNLRWGADGLLYVTGQDLDPETFRPCLASDIATCPYEGATVVTIDPATDAVHVLFETATDEYGHATVALPVSNGEVWLGSVFGGATAILRKEPTG